MAKTLFKAVRSADLWRVKFLITRGLRINSRDEEGEGVLLAALQIDDDKKRNKVFRWLLSQGADALSVSKGTGRDALFWSVYLNRRNEVDVILKDFAGELDITRKDAQGRTVLHYAVLHDSVAILESLCHVMRKYELSVDVTDAEGLTPYLWAVRLGHSACAQVLRAVGMASPHKCDEKTRQSSHFWEALGAKERRELQRQRKLKKSKALRKALNRLPRIGSDGEEISMDKVPDSLDKYNKLALSVGDIKAINDKLELSPTARHQCLPPLAAIVSNSPPVFLPAMDDVAASVISSADVTHTTSHHDIASTVCSSRLSVQSEPLESVSFVGGKSINSSVSAKSDNLFSMGRYSAGNALSLYHSGGGQGNNKFVTRDFARSPIPGRVESSPAVAVSAFMGVLSQQCTNAFRPPARRPSPPREPDVSDFRVVAKAGLFTSRMKRNRRHKLDTKIVEEPELEADAVGLRSARRKPLSKHSSASFDRDHLPVLVSS